MGKLGGIINFLYGENMPQDIKNMFTHLVDKTVACTYIEYGEDYDESGQKPFRSTIDFVLPL